MVVTGVSRGVPSGPAAARRAGAERGFRIKGEGARQPGPAVGAPAVSLGPLLALQEVGSEGQEEMEARQDRQARTQGEAMLDELGGMQLALLGGAAPEAGRLAALAKRQAGAADPGLDAVLRAVRLRAAVEIARRAGSFRENIE